MEIFVYRTSGGKNILSKLSNEVMPILLTVLEGMQRDGLENFSTKPIDKNIRPVLYEIRKNDVRIFYYKGLDGSINITNITEHKQKNRTEKRIKRRLFKEKNGWFKIRKFIESISKLPPESEGLYPSDQSPEVFV